MCGDVIERGVVLERLTERGGGHAMTPQVRSTVLRFDAFHALRRLTVAGGLFKELRLPAGLRQLTLGAGLMYNDISGARRSVCIRTARVAGSPCARQGQSCEPGLLALYCHWAQGRSGSRVYLHLADRSDAC